jgi:hypothetical protein
MAVFAEFSFWQQLALNVTGPVATAVVGTLVIGTLVARVTKRAQDRREDHALRERLVSEATEAASRLYMETQRYWRAKDDRVSDEELSSRRERLDENYHRSRVQLLVMESRLKTYFPSGEARLLCHRAADLLTVRYFHLIGRDTVNVRRLNAGAEHSGLTAEQLNVPRTLLDKYHATLEQLVHAILSEPLVLGPTESGGWRAFRAQRTGSRAPERVGPGG